MQCICGKELIGKQKYCSGACRVKASRERSVTDEGASVTETTPEVLQKASVTPRSVTDNSLSVTNTPEIPLESTSNSQPVRAETISVTDNPLDDIYSEEYDTSEAGFKRRNKNWSDFKPQFRADTVVACKRINKRNLAGKAEYMSLKRDAWEGVSAVRGEVTV